MFSWLKLKTPKLKSLGQAGEELAQAEYKQRGYKVIAANFFNKKGLRVGEIDFIAIDKSRIVFVEVKTRSAADSKFGSGAEAVNQFKQIKILKAVKVFLQKNPSYFKLIPQIDVCIVQLTGVDKKPKSVTIIANAVEDWN